MRGSEPQDFAGDLGLTSMEASLLHFDAASLLGAGEEEVEKQLRGLLPDTEVSGGVEKKAFSDALYVSLKKLGLSVRLRPCTADGVVDSVFLYNEGVDGFAAYRGPMPQELAWSDCGADIVARFGEPSNKFGGNRLPIGITYDTLGLDIHLDSRTWEDARAKISFLTLFVPEDQALDLCPRCAKLAKFRCGRCGLQRYCSSACQRADWTEHQAVCVPKGGRPAPRALSPVEADDAGAALEAHDPSGRQGAAVRVLDVMD